MKSSNIPKQEILEQQAIIKEILTIELKSFNKLKSKYFAADLRINRLREQYLALDKALYLQTHEITQLKPYMPRKNKQVSERIKLIRRLIKQLPNGELKTRVKKLYGGTK